MLYNISFRSIAYLSAVLMKFIVKRRSEDENSVGYHSVIIFKKLCSDMGGRYETEDKWYWNRSYLYCQEYAIAYRLYK